MIFLTIDLSLTYSVSHIDPDSLSTKLSDQYDIIADYMAANRLVINADKTHMVVMGNKKAADLRRQVNLSAGEHLVVQRSCLDAK